jgi:hypothetical protein
LKTLNKRSAKIWRFTVRLTILGLVFLPGFQKGRDIKAFQGKGHGAVLVKKGQFASYKEKLEKWTEFHYF